MRILLAIVGIVAFWISFEEQRFELCVYINLGAFALSLFQFGPGWPIFRRDEPKWLAANFDNTILSEPISEAEFKKNR